MKEGVMFPLFVIAGLILVATTCIFTMVYLLSSGLLAQRLAEGDIVSYLYLQFLSSLQVLPAI